MGKTIKDTMTSNPCSIDVDKPVSYAAKMMRDEDVGWRQSSRATDSSAP